MALLVMLMVTSQVAITIFLPSLPSMAGDLGTSQALVQMTETNPAICIAVCSAGPGSVDQVVVVKRAPCTTPCRRPG